MRSLANVMSIALAAVVAASQPAAAQGQFKGKLVAELLKDGRNIKLVQPFSYVDANGQVWDVPAGFKTDGASIPRVFWLTHPPFTGKYREAAVIHDRYCSTKSRSWQDTHNVFYEAMLASGVETRTAKVMWAAVYNFGDRWGKGVKRRAFPATVEEEQQFMRDLDAWVARADPSTEDIAKAVDSGRIPR